MYLKNKTVVITGAAGGFGAELTQLLCKKGARVHALDINEPGLKTLADKMRLKGHAIHTHKLDVTSLEAWQDFGLSFTKKQTAPDVWINNAGIAHTQLFSKTTPEHFDAVMRVNVDGVVCGTRTALSLMTRHQKGIIVNVTSLSGHIPLPLLVSYTTAKHAIVGFTRSLRLELEQQAANIKLLLVSPGFADTAIMKNNPEFLVPQWLKWSISQPQDVARDIVKAIEKETLESFPGVTGKLMLRLHHFLPDHLYKVLVRLMTPKNV